jgi:hypothetical protein
VAAAKLAAGLLVGLLFAAVTTAVVLAVALPWLAAKGVPIRFGGAVGRELVGVLAAAALSGCWASRSAPCCGTRSPRSWPRCCGRW